MISIQPQGRHLKIRLSIKSKKQAPRKSTSSTLPSDSSSSPPGHLGYHQQTVTQFTLKAEQMPQWPSHGTSNKPLFEREQLLSSIKAKADIAPNESQKKQLGEHHWLNTVDPQEWNPKDIAQQQMRQFWTKERREEQRRGFVQFWFSTGEEQIRHDKYKRRGIMPLRLRGNARL